LDNGRGKLIRKQFDDLTRIHSGLELSEDFPNRWAIRGNLSFDVTYAGKNINDTFSILISIPKDYPQSPPAIQETGGRIPRAIDYHILPDAGNFCLSTPLRVRLKFQKNPTLLYFVNGLVIPFLFSFSYKKLYGNMPYGEFSHGRLGIFESYQELFGITEPHAVLGLLKILAEDCYRGHLPCPCGNGERIRHCHGRLIREICIYQSQDEFLLDYLQCITYLNKSGVNLDKSVLLSKKVMKHWKRLTQGFDKNKKRGTESVKNENIE